MTHHDQVLKFNER